MSKELTADSLKKIIFEAFKDVPKGDGLGVRECDALDSYADKDKQAKARSLDVERHWWEYPDELKENRFQYALSYNNKQGQLFHFPALMTAVVDEATDMSDIPVYMALCVHTLGGEPSPHHGHRAYVEFRKGFKVSAVAQYYGFTPEQIHAIALYFLWEVHHKSHYGFFSSRQDLIESETRMHEGFTKHARPGDYTLTLEDALAIKEEEHRILRDWFAAGAVDPHEWVVNTD